MDCSMSGFPVHNQLPEFTQTHVHWLSNAIQPSHSRSPPSPSPFSLFQHGGLFQWVGSSYRGQSTEDSMSVLPMNSQGWFPLGLTGLILAAHETLNSLLHHYSSKASVLQCSAFSMVQLLISWVRESLSVVSDSSWLHGRYIACQIPCSWNFPGKNTEWVAIPFSRRSSQCWPHGLQ